MFFLFLIDFLFVLLRSRHRLCHVASYFFSLSLFKRVFLQYTSRLIAINCNIAPSEQMPIKLLNVWDDEQRQIVFKFISIMIEVFKSIEHFSWNHSYFVFYRLSRDEQRLIKEAVETATDYWSRAIRPKYQSNSRIRLTRYSIILLFFSFWLFFSLTDNVHREKCLLSKMIIRFIIVRKNVFL